MYVVGTMGTSDTGGTSLTIPGAADPLTGAVYQKEVGTPNFILVGGTLQSGTIGNINAIGTIGTLGLGSVVVNSGTVLNTGTNVNIVSGSLVGTIQTGTVAVTTGTIVGPNASAGTSTTAPLQIGGTTSTGTVYGFLIDTAGHMKNDIVSGSLVGTILGGTIQNLNFGTVLNTGTNVNLVTGTVNVGTVTATLTSNGTLTALGLGTVTGVTANAGSYTGNPVGVGGTDSGGTIRNVLVNSSGQLTTNLTSSGTILNLATGTLASLPAVSLTSSGTILNLATGTLASLPAVSLTSSGTLLNLASGTLASVTTVSNLTNGSVVVTVGTITTGSITNLALINAGTLTALGIGTILKSSPAASAGSFTAAGSVVVTGSQYDAASFDLQGTWVGTTFFEAQIGTSSWFSIPAVNSLGVSVGSATANGDYFVDMSSLDGVRARLTYSSGTQTYNARASAFAPNTVTVSGGSQNLLTTVSNLTNGSVVMTVGTMTTGTLQNLVTGTINALAAGTITGGTLQNLVSGTINSGTIVMTTGTLSPIPTISQSCFGTLGTTGAAVFGTMVGGTGSGAGTEIFVTGLSIVLPATGGSQDVGILFGTNGGNAPSGTGVLTRLFPLVGGGIARTFTPPLNSGTNAQLCYWLSGAGTAYFEVSYFTTTSTL